MLHHVAVHDTSLVDYSVLNCLFDAQRRGKRQREDDEVPSTPAVDSRSYSASPSSLPVVSPDLVRDVLRQACRESAPCDRAIGALLGLVVGDAIGAPLEFLPCRTTSALDPHHHLRDRLTEEEGELCYVGEENRFQLQRGQWTDDSSMALCLADSLLLCSAGPSVATAAATTMLAALTTTPTTTTARHCFFNGGDCRIRFFHWWHHGYNNSFRYDAERRGASDGYGGTSVGLGGNISESLRSIAKLAKRKQQQQPAAGSDPSSLRTEVILRDTDVPPSFADGGGANDAGNGAIMRLASVAIRYHHPRDCVAAAAMHAAAASSRTTHRGEESVACCQFMTWFMRRAMQRPEDAEISLAAFVDETVGEFVSLLTASKVAEDASCTTTGSPPLGLVRDPTARRNLLAVLTSTAPSDKESCWVWRDDSNGASSQYPLRLQRTVKARGATYNGYPVSRGYFGSYAMDALAIALWALHRPNTTSFSDVILSVVNLLGDCDSTGAVAGQLAGAFFGSRALTDTAMGATMVRLVRQWDPRNEIELRAMMLFLMGDV